MAVNLLFPSRFAGEQCAESSNDCANNRCENNAECIDLHRNYTCACAPGFTGAFCGSVIQVRR